MQLRTASQSNSSVVYGFRSAEMAPKMEDCGADAFTADTR